MRRHRENPPWFVPPPPPAAVGRAKIDTRYVWDAARRAWVLREEGRHRERFRRGEVRMDPARGPVFPPAVPEPTPRRRWAWTDAGGRSGSVHARGRGQALHLLALRGVRPVSLERVERHGAAEVDPVVFEKREKALELLGGYEAWVGGPEPSVPHLYLGRDDKLALSPGTRSDALVREDGSRPGVVGWSQSIYLKVAGRRRRLLWADRGDGFQGYVVEYEGRAEPVYELRAKRGKERTTVWRWSPGTRPSPRVRLDGRGEWEVAAEGNPYCVVAADISGGPFFTRTSKMGCLSWNLPAGPPSTRGQPGLGGTCPSATPLAAAVGRERAEAAWEGMRREVAAVSGKILPVAATSSGLVCGSCYALKGNYQNMNQQAWATLRKVWVEAALDRDPSGAPLDRRLPPEERARRCAFVPLMAGAIARAYSAGHRAALADERVDHRFFRIHDAGDFWRPDYLHAWAEVCRLLPEVSFWAPTRQWMKPGWLERFQVASRRAPNLAIRPSALRFEDRAPVLPGMAAGSAAARDEVPGHWTCPAMYTEAGSCIGALNVVAGHPELRKPDWWERVPWDEHACRVCWGGHPYLDPRDREAMRQTVVSYHKH